jgi:hypothetical protein
MLLAASRISQSRWMFEARSPTRNTSAGARAIFPPGGRAAASADDQSNANRDRRANGRAWRDRADRVSWAVISTAVAY